MGQGHNSEVRLTDQTVTSTAPRDIVERTQQPSEQAKQPKVPQTTKEAVKPPTLPNKAEDIAKKRLILEDFVQQCQEMAKQAHRNQLDALQAQAKPIYVEIERLKDSEPWNPFKIKAWQAELDKKVAQHNDIKSSFDDLKSQGVTTELIKTVHAEEHRRNPTEYQNIGAIEDEIIAYDQEQVKALREQRQQRKDIEINIKGKDMDIDM